MGLISDHLDVDDFTDHARLYVDTLAVAEKAEVRGIGRALMAFTEGRGRDWGCREVVLDVFANNETARTFYERSGYAADRVRMAKPLNRGLLEKSGIFPM
jgi:ribosomal protein S18 acetylase RimI-like enzyme